MMIALPNLDGSFTCTLFWPKTGEGGLDSLRTPGEITGWFEQHYPDVVELMPNLVEDYQVNPVGSLVTVRCWPWVNGRVALVGDAAHAIVPFYGQGANAAMEDCIEIVRCLDATGGNWPTALAEYQKRRKPNADAIANYALQNFIEMRDTVNSRAFRAKTAVQHALERRSGGRYVSRYELVSFTTVPYSQIKHRLRQQNRVVAGAGIAAGGGGCRPDRCAASAPLRLNLTAREPNDTDDRQRWAPTTGRRRWSPAARSCRGSTDLGDPASTWASRYSPRSMPSSDRDWNATA